MDEVRIRSMVRADIPAVHEIEDSHFGDAWPVVAFEECLIFNENILLQMVDTKEIIGYLIGSGVDDEYSIYNIAIKNGFHRRGYASFLLENLLNQHVGRYKNYFLEVRESNTAAIKFYEKYDFRVIYVRRNYYPNPVENALVMQLSIDRM
jgi:ribosomal-protein-alanine N-acetyltransferase